MSTELIKYAFISGEISPTLFGRTDLTKYDLAMALAYNWFVDYRGGLTTRPGTEFLEYLRDDHLDIKLVEFQFSPDLSNTYLLIFGHAYIRFVQNGSYVLEGAKGVSGIVTAGGRTFVNITGHGYSSGQWVKMAGVNGVRDLNGRAFVVNVINANQFEILDPRNNDWINRDDQLYLSGGTAARVYEIGTTYDWTELRSVKCSQIRDLIRITHPNHPIRNLRRFDHTNWQLTNESIGGPSFSDGTWGLSISPHTAGTAKMSVVYAVSAIMSDGAESTICTPQKVNGATNFSIEAGSIKLDWNDIPGAVEYNVYRTIIVPQLGFGDAEIGNQLGFIGRTTVSTFTDSNIVPDFTKSPIEAYNPFPGAGTFPSISTTFQQRQIYAASYNQPMTFWASQVGRFNNFDTSKFTVESDSYEFEVDASQVAPLLHFKSLRGGLLMFSMVGIWLLTGGNSGAVTPSNALADPQSYTGVSDVPPLQVGSDLLYIEGKGFSTRLLSYNDFSKVYSGEDKSILSNHLFSKYRQIVSWSFAENPYKMVIGCRTDGALLMFTSVKEQDVYAWTWGETKGWFRSVLCINEDGQDVPYTIVERIINGSHVKYLERIVIEEWTYAEDSFCVDSGLRYEPPQQAGTINISTETTNAEGEKFVTLTANGGASFTGKLNWKVRAAGGIFSITQVTSSTVAVAKVLESATEVVPGYGTRVQSLRAWFASAGVKEFTGLQHLEGEVVSILGDGNVFQPQQVVNGKITLPDAVSKARIGLGYTCIAKTLPPTVPDVPIEARRKRIVAIAGRFYRTRGIETGRDLNNLYEMRERSNENYGASTKLINGVKYQLLDTTWEEDAQTYIVQKHPLPGCVLGLVPDLEVGDDTN